MNSFRKTIIFGILALSVTSLFGQDQGTRPQPQCPVECKPHCQPPVACEKFDYAPWVRGKDPGLWCLPGSRCSYCCPTCPTGSQLYCPWSSLVHLRRFPSQYSARDWHTIMMHMRMTIPMPACDYRKITAFLMESSQPYGVVFGSDVAEDVVVTDYVGGLYAPPAQQDEIAADDTLLEDELGDLGGVEFAAGDFEETTVDFDRTLVLELTEAPSFNFAFVGEIVLDYRTNYETPTGFNGNDSFNFGVVPQFLISYEDSFLAQVKLFGANYQIDNPLTVINIFNPFFGILYANVSYFFNDWITITAGQNLVPLGAYYNFWAKWWMNKLPSDPMFRPGLFNPNNFFIAPVVDTGLEVKGAIPLCCLNFCSPSTFFTYDFMVSNGPAEFFGQPFFFLTPVPKVNEKVALSGRLALFLNLDAFVGISGYYTPRWNGNDRTAAFFANFPNQSLYYYAWAVDWNWRICDSIYLIGEYLYTEYEQGLGGRIPFAPFTGATISKYGYWVQLSSFLSAIVPWIDMGTYCCNPCLWDSLELVLRGENFWSDLPNQNRGGISLGLNYYFIQTAKLQFEYDFNWGDLDFNRNQFTARINYAW